MIAIPNIIIPNWPAPDCIKAVTTLRTVDIGENMACLNLPNKPFWLHQVHSAVAIPVQVTITKPEADASFTDQPNQVCVILTADCLPVLLCNKQGTFVAAIHAGWRGLAKGVIENTIQALNLPPKEILAWLGPAISPAHFEVGDEVRECFMNSDPKAEQAFIPSPQGRWMGDLYHLARLRLNKLGIEQVYGGEYCTYSDSERFFSYRRDGEKNGEKTGRMASLIWISM